MALMYIRESGIRKILKEEGKRASKEYMHELDLELYKIVRRCCRVHNGGKKTVDLTVLSHVMGK